MIGLEAVDYVNAYIYCHDGTHYYGVKSGLAGTKFCRGTSYDNLAEVHDFATEAAGLSPSLAWSIAPGVVFAMCVSASTYKGYLYKSEDSGVTWAMVLRIGDTDGTDAGHIAYSNMIPRCFCVDEHRGKLYVGEYNYNGSRVTGGLNDKVALWESDDDGDTWFVVAQWNTDGTNQFRHIHGVLKDPYTHDIYIVTGEDDAGVIRWDGESTLASNTHPTEYTDWSTGAFGAGGSGKWRLCDILFDANWMYGFADSRQADNMGIFRIAKDLSSIESINAEIVGYDLHTGYLGVKTNSGAMHFIEFLEAGGTDKQLNLYSGTNGAFVLSAKYGVPSAPTSPRQIMAIGDLIFVSCSGAGKADLATAVVKESPFRGPKIVHPVYWVAKTGADTTGYPRGHRPSSPWLTVQYACLADRMTFGSRLIVEPGEYQENPIYPSWDANPRVGTGEVVIEGRGSENSKIVLKSGNEANYLFYLDGTELASRFFRIGITTLSATIGGLFRVKANHRCILEESRLGHRGITLGTFTYFGVDNGLHLLRSIAYGNDNTSFVNISSSCKFYGKGSVFVGFKELGYINGRANVTLHFLNCVAVNYLLRVFVFASGTTFADLKIKNSAFIGQAGSAPLVDMAGITETDEQIDYNYYNANLPSIANSGGTHKITADPKFYSAANLDFHLRVDSPLRNVGTIAGVTKDFSGENFAAVPSIGAYEYGPIRWGQKSFCDGILPLSAQPCKDHALPIGVGKITVFPGVATSAQIEEAK